MIIRAKDNTEIYNQDGAIGKLIGKENNCEYVKLCLQPGSKIEKHSLPFHVTFFVIKGIGDVQLVDSVKKVYTGDLIEVEPNQSRGWQNNFEDMLEVLVIKHFE